MALTKPSVLPTWAEAGDRVQPSNAEIQTGWPLSNVPPARQRFNWLLNFLMNGVRYFSRRGLPDYDAAETYMTGDRIIGDDGKTYRSLIDNNTAQTPSTSPTKWERWGFTFDEFLAGVATPPQFDNDTSLATTAFVQRALGNRSNLLQYNSTQSLSALAFGATVQGFGSSSFAIELPPTAGATAGSAIEFGNYCGGGANLTITSPSANISWNGVAASVSSIVLAPGDTVTLVWTGIGWIVTDGSVQLRFSAAFGSSLDGNGYQKLPSGLIIQWGGFSGSTAVNAGNGVYESNQINVTWPIAFPNACLQVITGGASDVGGAGLQEQAWNTLRTVGGGGFFVACRASGVSLNGSYITVGY